MSDERTHGDRIDAQITVGGNLSGQMAVGKRIEQRHVANAPGAITEAERAELHGVIEALRVEIATQVPPELQDAAMERVEELEEAVTAERPDLSTMEYVRNWFTKRCPAVAKSVTGVIVHPICTKLAAAAGDAMVADFHQRFGVF
ncbi:MAG: hypothetical protein ACRDZO_13715 [Egibacteraceae bacterium]